MYFCDCDISFLLKFRLRYKILFKERNNKKKKKRWIVEYFLKLLIIFINLLKIKWKVL